MEFFFFKSFLMRLILYKLNSTSVHKSLHEESDKHAESYDFNLDRSTVIAHVHMINV